MLCLDRDPFPQHTTSVFDEADCNEAARRPPNFQAVVVDENHPATFYCYNCYRIFYSAVMLFLTLSHMFASTSSRIPLHWMAFLTGGCCGHFASGTHAHRYIFGFFPSGVVTVVTVVTVVILNPLGHFLVGGRSGNGVEPVGPVGIDTDADDPK